THRTGHNTRTHTATTHHDTANEERNQRDTRTGTRQKKSNAARRKPNCERFACPERSGALPPDPRRRRLAPRCACWVLALRGFSRGGGTGTQTHQEHGGSTPRVPPGTPLTRVPRPPVAGGAAARGCGGNDRRSAPHPCGA